MCQPYICKNLAGYAARNRRATLCDFVQNWPRAPAAACVSDDQEMQLWIVSRTKRNRLASTPAMKFRSMTRLSSSRAAMYLDAISDLLWILLPIGL